jgi:hypothetical protein
VQSIVQEPRAFFEDLANSEVVRRAGAPSLRLVARDHACDKMPQEFRQLAPSSVRAEGPERSLESRINRLALQGEDTEHALVDTPERLPLDEALEPFDSRAFRVSSSRASSTRSARGQGALRLATTCSARELAPTPNTS